MSIKISGVIQVEGLAADGAETVIHVDVSELPNAGNIGPLDFTSVPPSVLIDTLAAKLRDAQNRTNSMLVAGLAE